MVKDFPVIKEYWAFQEEIPDELQPFFNENLRNYKKKKPCILGFIQLGEDCDNPQLIPVEINDKKMNNLGIRLGRIALYPDADNPIITLTSEYYNNMRKGKANKFVIYHEVGHFLNKHYEDELDQDQMMSERIEQTQNGNLYYQEAEADLTAAYYLGKEDVLVGINQCRSSFVDSVSGKDIDFNNFSLVLTEYKLREENVEKRSKNVRKM